MSAIPQIRCSTHHSRHCKLPMTGNHRCPTQHSLHCKFEMTGHPFYWHGVSSENNKFNTIKKYIKIKGLINYRQSLKKYIKTYQKLYKNVFMTYPYPLKSAGSNASPCPSCGALPRGFDWRPKNDNAKSVG